MIVKKSELVKEASDKSLAAAIYAERLTNLFGVGKDKVLALYDVSVAIKENEFFTLLGPSGCGKTTLLRLIAGFDDPTEGIIMLNGQDIYICRPFSARSIPYFKVCAVSAYDRRSKHFFRPGDAG